MRKHILITTIIYFIFSGHLLTTVNAEANSVNISGEAAVLMDSQAGAVLYGKNETVRMYPASLTKIATAIYAIENGNLTDVVTISEEEMLVDGTRVYLTTGEQVTLLKLIQGMLINSGNDASIAIARHMDGSVEQFSQNLNTYLREKVGVHETHFTNPHGLFDQNHYTTALDMAKITNYALKNEIFINIFGTIELSWKGEAWESTLYTHHRLLKGEIPYEGITGGKTGFVNEARHTLATSAENGQIKLTAIVLKADKSFIYTDTVALLDYGFANFKSVKLPQSTVFLSEGNQSFITSKETFITEPITEESMKNVDETGLLSVKTNTGELIQTLKLEPVKVQEVVNQETPKNLHQSDSLININTFYGLFIVVVLGAAVTVFTRNRERG